MGANADSRGAADDDDAQGQRAGLWSCWVAGPAFYITVLLLFSPTASSPTTLCAEHLMDFRPEARCPGQGCARTPEDDWNDRWHESEPSEFTLALGIAPQIVAEARARAKARRKM